MRKTLYVLVFALSISLIGCSIAGKKRIPENTAAPQITETPQATETPISQASPGTEEIPQNNAESITYSNIKYGFNFILPVSWKNYSIITDKWEGTALEGSQSGQVTETGEIIKIRHPEWTSENPRQDIPIMMFTLGQWELVKNEKLSIGAAPVPPSELERNSKYVFALPARYNFAFPKGYKEVEEILAGSPLKPTENIE